MRDNVSDRKIIELELKIVQMKIAHWKAAMSEPCLPSGFIASQGLAFNQLLTDEYDLRRRIKNLGDGG